MAFLDQSMLQSESRLDFSLWPQVGPAVPVAQTPELGRIQVKYLPATLNGLVLEGYSHTD